MYIKCELYLERLFSVAPNHRPQHAKMCIWAYVVSGGPDQPVHPQSDQGLHCPLTESLDTIEYINGGQLPV